MKSPTTIILLRHGEVYNPQDVFFGRLPRFPLSDEGRRQAEAACDYLKTLPLVGIVSSPLLRARQTAKIIGQGHPKLKLQFSRLLLEIYSPFDGLSRSIPTARHWDLYSGIDPQYEQPGDILERARKFIAQARRRYAGQQVAVVTHSEVIAFFRLWVNGEELNAENAQRIFSAPATIHVFTFHTDGVDERPDYQYIKPY